ncbi:MAG: IS110 family transposase [Streptosporangiaceae bacterium]
MTVPGQVDVWVGLDVGREDHFADVLDNDGERLFARAVANDQADLEALLDRAAGHGTPGLVIDQPGSIARLALAVAARRGTPVAYVPGLVMRRAADLYPGEAKTDRRDACVIADTGRTRRKQVHWLDASSGELLAALRVLNGCDIDLAADQTRLASRLRDALTSIAPALERAVGDRLHQAGVRDLIARYPTLTALRAAGQSRIERTVRARSPRIAARVTAAVAAALAARDVTVPAEAATGRVIADLAASWTAPAPAATPWPPRSRRRSFPALPVSCWPPCQGSGRGPAPGSSPRSATAPPSPAAASSLPTPAWPRSPASPAPP